jgi:hypothetical protein
MRGWVYRIYILPKLLPRIDDPRTLLELPYASLEFQMRRVHFARNAECCIDDRDRTSVWKNKE